MSSMWKRFLGAFIAASSGEKSDYIPLLLVKVHVM